MNDFQSYYKMLNTEQAKVVDKTDGPLLVLAGPGTGKTQLLSVRAANIIRKNKVEPGNILILTFTNAAAREMRERLARIIGPEGYDIEVETFHSFANSIVLESEGAVKYVKDKIDINDVEKVKALQHILDTEKGVEALRPFGNPYIHLSEVGSRISELKNEGISPGDFKRKLKGVEPDGVMVEEKHISRLKALSVVYENYEKLKDTDSDKLFDKRGRKDYDDMILIARDALENEGELRDAFRAQYRYIMVDEYQDTNGAQMELLFTIIDPEQPNICCVGDDDQSIFRFQGATLANFRVLKDRFAGLQTIALKDNYRSCKNVVELSGRIIKQLPSEERIEDKELKARAKYDSSEIVSVEFMTKEEELGFIVNEIRRQADIIENDKTLTEEERAKPYNNIAVLVRKRDQILVVIDALLKAGIPYATDGEEDIRHEKRVRQMLNVLELAASSTYGNERKSLILYKILLSDYVKAVPSDILKFIGFINNKKRSAKEKGREEFRSYNLYEQFLCHFPVFKKDRDGCDIAPSEKESRELKISRELGLEDPHSLHQAAWTIRRLVTDAESRPVHDILLGYIEDAGLYRFILQRYEHDKVVRMRDLRALVSFVNVVKSADMSSPGVGLEDFMQELELREAHSMPLRGELATLSQEGVRVYTAHKSKGLEFYTVFIPFCLHKKSWPFRGKGAVIPLPPGVCESREAADAKEKKKLLDEYDELRLFYVASTRAKANLVYTATPVEKVIVSPFLSHMGLTPRSGAPDDEEKFLAEYLCKTPGKDPFEDTSEILKDIVSRITLNPTSLNNYISCKRKFLFDNVLMLPGKKNQHLTFGNCAHKALEEVYSFYMEKKKFPDFGFFKKSFNDELEFQGVSDSIKRWCSDRLDSLEGWYDGESEDPVMPLDLENKLEITLPDGIVFRGTFDKIERESEESIRVIDYKTGKPDDHVKAIANCTDLSSHDCDDYYRQLVAYKMLYERTRKPGEPKKAVAKGVLQFLEPVSRSYVKYRIEKGRYHNEVVELTSGKVSELEDVIKACWKDMQALSFEKLPEREGQGRCGRCEYDPICWEER